MRTSLFLAQTVRPEHMSYRTRDVSFLVINAQEGHSPSVSTTCRISLFLSVSAILCFHQEISPDHPDPPRLRQGSPMRLQRQRIARSWQATGLRSGASGFTGGSMFANDSAAASQMSSAATSIKLSLSRCGSICVEDFPFQSIFCGVPVFVEPIAQGGLLICKIIRLRELTHRIGQQFVLHTGALSVADHPREGARR